MMRSLVHVRLFCLGLLGASSVLACSGAASDNGLFGGADTGPSAGDSGPGQGPGPGPNDGGPGPDPSPRDGGPGQGDATLPPDSGPHKDSGAHDTGVVDTGVDAGDPGIRCFGEVSKYCPLSSTCCVTSSETAGICGDAPACVNAGGTAFPCADQRNCAATPGAVCCATWDDVDLRYTSVSCEATCPQGSAEILHQLCDPGTKPDECASVGLTCMKPPTTSGYAYCQ